MNHTHHIHMLLLLWYYYYPGNTRFHEPLSERAMLAYLPETWSAPWALQLALDATDIGRPWGGTPR